MISIDSDADVNFKVHQFLSTPAQTLSLAFGVTTNNVTAKFVFPTARRIIQFKSR